MRSFESKVDGEGGEGQRKYYHNDAAPPESPSQFVFLGLDFVSRSRKGHPVSLPERDDKGNVNKVCEGDAPYAMTGNLQNAVAEFMLCQREAKCDALHKRESGNSIRISNDLFS